MLKIRRWLLLIGLLCVPATVLGACIGTRHTVDNLLYNNYKHYLPCEQLPTRQEVDRVLEEHADAVAQIKAALPVL